MKTANLAVQKWGNSLAVRIPATLARNAHFHIGTPVELALQNGSIVIRPTGEPKLSLEERLKLFDPTIHGGEVMASEPEGEEKL
jgi:antitoxin MazE